jgi:predicted phosphodiesterase
MRDIRKWIIMSDMQVPYQDNKALAVVEKYMAAHRWDGYLNIGDFLDMDSISSFNKGKPGNTEGIRIWEDYNTANKILDRHQAIVRKRNPKAEFVMLEGNHEERVGRFFAENPIFKGGPMDVDKALRLKERGFKWVKAWSEGEDYKIGHAHFTHGQYTNRYHAAKMVENYGESIFYGHTHDIMCMPKASKLHPETVLVGQSIGCLCKRDLAYMKGRPSNWQLGFAVFFFLPNGNYTYYVVRIFDYAFVGPDGVLYST